MSSLFCSKTGRMVNIFLICERHASWLRIYAIRLEPNVYIVTGGAIKLTRTMQEREHTAIELRKLNRCKNFLQANGVFDKDGFVELTND